MEGEAFIECDKVQHCFLISPVSEAISLFSYCLGNESSDKIFSRDFLIMHFTV